MNWLTNEALFYSGLAIVGGSLILGIIFFCISKIKSIQLKNQFDKEYGEDN